MRLLNINWCYVIYRTNKAVFLVLQLNRRQSNNAEPHITGVIDMTTGNSKLSTIESKGYVATAADIEKLAEQQSTHLNASRWQLPATYLRALVATTQADLGITSIKRKPGKATDEALQAQLEALAKVQEVFYEAVQKGAARVPVDPEDTRDQKAVVASRVVFARSSYSTVRNWILRGRYSLEGLNPRHATKRTLYDQTPRPERVRSTSAVVLTKQATRMLDTILEQAKTNREQAVAALQAVINALSKGFDDMGLPAVEIRDAVEHTATTVIQEATARLQDHARRQVLPIPPKARGRPPAPRMEELVPEARRRAA